MVIEDSESDAYGMVLLATSSSGETLQQSDVSTVGKNDAWTPSRIALVIVFFLLAGLFEIAGGWFVWVFVRGRENWQKDGHTWWVCLFGCVSLVAYGFIPTLQPINDFGRVYAAYGGVFIALSFVWAYLLDGFVPDKGDIIGACIALVGVSVVLFWPR